MSFLSFPVDAQPTNTPVHPNIVLILADDLGYGDLGCYGQQKIRTPNINELAVAGMRFTDCYAGAPVCGPSRSVLMTGRHTGHTRVRGNTCRVGGITVGNKRRMHLTDKDITVGNILQDAGYRTCLIGKWHLEGFNPEAIPLNRGFDEFYGWQIWAIETHEPHYFPARRFFNYEIKPLPENANGKRGLYETDLVFRQGCEFIERNTNRPFFLYLAPSAPHSPLVAPDFGPYSKESWTENAKTYAAMVHYLDRGVGWIMATLKDTGLDTNTIVFFASDNGPRSEPTSELTEVVDFFDSNGRLRGYKRDMYEGGIRVPMIVRWPGQVPAGQVNTTTWYFADFMSTAAELAGATAVPNTDGISMAPLILGKKQPVRAEPLYWEFFERGFEQAMRSNEWKVVRHELDQSSELYNLLGDLGERANVAMQNSNILTQMEFGMSRARTDSKNWPIPTQPANVP